MSGFGDDMFGVGPFGSADWSYAMLWEKWPERLRALAAERGGFLEPFTMAILPIFDNIIEKNNEFARVWNAWQVKAQDALVPTAGGNGFWFTGGAEYKDSDTVTLYGETDHVRWDTTFQFMKGAVYSDTAGRKFLVKEVRQGFPIGTVKNGVTYSRLIEVDVRCGDVSQISPSTVPTGVGQSWCSQNGLLEFLASTLGAKFVPELTEGNQRSLVGRFHDLVRLKGSDGGIESFAKAHGCTANVKGLYWLGKAAIEKVAPGDIYTGVQKFERYPIAWGDGTKSLLSSDGSVGDACKYLKDDDDYRGALVSVPPGSQGHVLVQYGITSALGVEKWYSLYDDNGVLKPYAYASTTVVNAGSIDYSTGAIVVYGYDLAAGYVLRPFIRGEPIQVSFWRYGQYVEYPLNVPLFDEIPADHATADTPCRDDPRTWGVTVGPVMSTMPPYTYSSVHEFDIVLAGETVQYPIMAELGTVRGAWGNVAGAWVLTDVDGNEFSVEQVKRPPLGPVAAATLRVYGAIAPVLGAASLSYLCPDGDSCGWSRSNKVWLSVVMTDFLAFVGAATDYSLPLLTRLPEVQCLHEENVKPNPLAP